MPAYRIVVADSRTQRDGRSIEEIGFYDPTTDPVTFKVHEEKAISWLDKGAVPTETVKTLFRRAGVLEKWQSARSARGQSQGNN